MFEAYLEAYKVVGELYTAEIKRLDVEKATFEDVIAWMARMDAFKEAASAIFGLMYPQENKKTADGGNRQRPEK